MWGLFKPTKTARKKSWRQATDRIAFRASFHLDEGQPNPDWIMAHLSDEFPDATKCQILTALAHETHEMISLFVRANAPILDHSSDAGVDDWSDTYHAQKSDEFIRLYWPVLRLVRSIYYEDLMSRDYGDYAGNAAQKVVQMWVDTFETGPSSHEKLEHPQEGVIRYTPFRIETIVMAFKTLFRFNVEDTEFHEHLSKSLFYIPFRYNLNEEETQRFFEAWDNFVLEQGR